MLILILNGQQKMQVLIYIYLVVSSSGTDLSISKVLELSVKTFCSYLWKCGMYCCLWKSALCVAYLCDYECANMIFQR